MLQMLSWLCSKHMREQVALICQACLSKWQLVMPGLKNPSLHSCTSLPAQCVEAGHVDSTALSEPVKVHACCAV